MQARQCSNPACGFPLPPDAVRCPICGEPCEESEKTAEESAIHVVEKK